jgi:hypothetical protein
MKDRLTEVRGMVLRWAAYRVSHGGMDPPPNSRLSLEKEYLLGPSSRPGPWRRLWSMLRGRPPGQLPDRLRLLSDHLVLRAFLLDDFTDADVVSRLEAWPMVTAYRPEGRSWTGEWFAYSIQVRAESPRQARFLIDCIFLAEAPRREEEEAEM